MSAPLPATALDHVPPQGERDRAEHRPASIPSSTEKSCHEREGSRNPETRRKSIVHLRPAWGGHGQVNLQLFPEGPPHVPSWAERIGRTRRRRSPGPSPPFR